mmetsp:Transcript_25040/g.41538  ORF Transcript_25040/g.41538 Transcript_25040/m.41538 type:complete len:267 (+) Transcript_25040:706-1506(+)
MTLDPLRSWVRGRIATKGMIVTDMGRRVVALIDANMVNVHCNTVTLHLTAETWIEITGTFWVCAIKTFFTRFRNVVGETPSGGDGQVENQGTWLVRNLRAHQFSERFIFQGKGVDPVFAQTVSFHRVGTVRIVTFVTLGEPVKSTTWTWLPLETKGVRRVKVSCRQLMNSSDSISLEGLLLGTSHGFIGFGLSKVGTIEKWVNRRVSFHYKSVIPSLFRWCYMSIGCLFVCSNWRTTGLRTIRFDSRSNLQRKISIRNFNRWVSGR